MTEHLLQLLSKKAAVCTTFLLLFGVNTLLAQSPSLDTTLAIDLGTVMNLLQDAPIEGTAKAKSKPFTIILPRPDGAGVEYQVEASEIMEKSFYLNYPSIKTYTLVNKKNQAYGRMVVSPSGLHSFIVTDKGSYYIDPVDKNNPVDHRVYYSIVEAALGECGFDETQEEFKDDLKRHFERQNAAEKTTMSNGSTMRNYRIAITTTGEFYQSPAFGNGNLINTLTAICVVVSYVSVKYELELAVRFTGVVVNGAIYDSPVTDPFVPDASNGVQNAHQAAAVIGLHYNTNDYDLGHCLHATPSSNSGQARVESVCDSDPLSTPPGYSTGGTNKGSGWSGGANPNLLIYAMWHEVGHQFGMLHTFNGTGGACTSTISDESAYEIGSGTTIMSYNGRCQSDNNIPSGGTADEYFHGKSLEQALTYMGTISNCTVPVPTGNTPPTVNANPCGGTYTIPIGTPFKLVGSGSDPGNSITYTWEQIDEDGFLWSYTQGYIGPQAAGSSLAPLFRSYPPSHSPIRYFPNLNLIKANNYVSSFESLPTVDRELNFRLTARDNRIGGGGFSYSDITIDVDDSGPFQVMYPNGGESLTVGNSYDVTWNPNGSNSFCSNVDIKLSTDGGDTYPYTLKSSITNDGSENVTIPFSIPGTTTARLMVACADNDCVVFFDISDSNFSIISSCNSPVIDSTVITQPTCSTPTGTVTVDANGSGPLEYSIDNGLSYQTSATFTGLSPGDYNVWARIIPSGTGSNTSFTNVAAFDSYVATNCQNCIVDIDGFESFASGQPITQLNYSSTSVTLSPGILAFHGAWQLFPGCQATFSGSSMLATSTYNTLPAVLSFSEPIFAFGGVFYDDGAPVGTITLTAITTLGQTITVNETCNLTGDTGFLGVFSPDGINTIQFTINFGAVELDNMKVVQAPICPVAYSGNPVHINIAPTPAMLNTPDVTQPLCTLGGSININASSSSALEYSVTDGSTYQESAMFCNLAPGIYDIKVRLKSDPNCTTTYAGNPILIDPLPALISCTSLIYPANGASNISGPVTLEWAPASGSPSGYILRMGTYPGGFDILNNWIVGNVQTFNVGVLPCGKTIYVAITPYNSCGNAIGCVEESFSTAGCPQNLVINLNPIPSGIHQAVIAISSTGRVESNSNVVFNAGNNISLDPAFEVELSGLFEADIDPSISLLPPNNTSNAKKKEKGGKFTSKSGGQIEFSAQMAKREPQKNYVIAHLVLPDPAFVSVSILENAGNSIYETQEQLYLTTGTTIFLLDMPADSPPGEYFIKANTGDQEIIKKVVLID